MVHTLVVIAVYCVLLLLSPSAAARSIDIEEEEASLQVDS